MFRYRQLPKTLISLLIALFAASSVLAQTGSKDNVEGPVPRHVSASPAFAEILLKAAIVEAELEELLVRYTEEFPKVREMRIELEELRASQKRLESVPEADSSKLSVALGKMLVQRSLYATELRLLKDKYSDDHPDVKRTAKKLQIFEKAITRIL